MRAVVSRVTRASVRVDGDGVARDGGNGDIVGEIDEPGLLVLLGVTHSDGAEQADRMARKLHEIRALRDEQSCADTGAPLLVVSQFTLYGSTRKGRRPSWTDAAPPEQAESIVDAVVERLRARSARVETGRFAATMAVESVNDGPFTVLVDV